ncbi:ATP-binding protein [Yinghuangia sp. ASG 101]|uniref:ATP-binding protein n=1 Tax=Yinghuangia sp. ASG 101 TaxID=2896848 RepID=UPI001E4D144D|nr:ATP-binding protein [Yinghuangia sp. ASG 101]UGQ15006.1 ATP-binding protein [Yinghuangia sp. ASG 101]
MIAFTGLRTALPVLFGSHVVWRGFLRSKECPRQSRKFVVSLLGIWGAESEACEWGALVVTELATNACVHTHSPVIQVVAARFRGVGYLAVVDDGPAPRKNPWAGVSAADDAVSGRGLQLVSAFSASSGRFRFGSGSLFWASHPLRD